MIHNQRYQYIHQEEEEQNLETDPGDTLIEPETQTLILLHTLTLKKGNNNNLKNSKIHVSWNNHRAVPEDHQGTRTITLAKPLR